MLQIYEGCLGLSSHIGAIQSGNVQHSLKFKKN